jgi:hypothetical protein
MTPEDQAQLQQSVQKIADILYRNTPHEQLQTLEGIEQAIRAQAQQYVMPELGVFLLQQALQQRMATREC